MASNIKTIYELLSDYSKIEIDNLIKELHPEEKKLLNDRYGNDLNNPKEAIDWTTEKSYRYYNILIPRMRRLLQKQKESKVFKTSQNSKIQIFDSYTSRLLELINEGKSNREICKILNITSTQLYRYLLELKNSGILIEKKYYSDGSIRYELLKEVFARERIDNYQNSRTLITERSENKLRFLAISDLHFGNELERKDLTERAFNYCVREGINIILCGGDLIDGIKGKGKRISDPKEQIDYFINNYPHDDSIITIAVVGDHDLSCFTHDSLYLPSVCENYRQDIVFGNHENTQINIKNDILMLYHKYKPSLVQQTDASLLLFAHSHKYVTNIKDRVLWVKIPPLSNLLQQMPSALEFTLSFGRGYIAGVRIRQIYFGFNDYVLNESTFSLKKTKKFPRNVIHNVE